MNHTSAKPDAGRLAAFLDGELPLDEQLAVESRLRDEAGLRAELDAMRALREGLKRQADYHAAPASLHRFAGELAQRPQARLAFRGGWPGFASRLLTPGRAAMAGMAVALMLSFGFFRLQGADDEGLLQQEAVAGHVRASLSQHRVDVASAEHHTVKPWLSARLDYSPPVPELNRPGLVFEGARVDYLDGRTVAVLVYRQGQHQVDAYVWPSARGRDAAPSLAVVKGFRVARWTQRGMAHCVVSDVNEEEFAGLVAALRQADGAP
jgi:anti-sigma factor RsiW